MTRPAASRDLTVGSTPRPLSASDCAASADHAPPAARLVVRRPRVRALAVAAALGASAFLAACSTQSPAQTMVPYQPADGVAANIGTVHARDLVLLTTAKGEPVSLSGAVINSGTDDVVVTFALTGSSASTTSPTTSASPTASPTSSAAADVNGSSGLNLAGAQHKQLTSIQFASSPAPPGAMTGVTMTTPAGSALVQVPVLPPTEYYSSLSPTAVATTKP